MLAIETKKLTKIYKTKSQGKIPVVEQIDLKILKGEIFGFLGPNGAGKTTTIKMLLGIIYPTSGEAKVFNRDVDQVRIHHQISYLPERPYYYEHMTGLEVLQFYASLFGIKDTQKCKDLLDRVNLSNALDKPLSQYSKGMQQRIGLAQCLINNPKLLILDEPSGGLDPIAHIEIRDLILSFREEGKTIFVSSHELSEVEKICDRVAIINKGRIQKEGDIISLLQEGRTEIKLAQVSNELNQKLQEIPNIQVLKRVEGVMLNIAEQINPNDIIDLCRKHNANIISLISKRKRLEDLFVETVQKDKFI